MRKSANDQSSLFRLVLIAAAITVFSAGGWATAKLTVDALLHIEAVSAARVAGNFVSNNISDWEQIAAGQQPSAATLAVFEQARQVSRMFGYRVFDADGNLRLRSGGADNDTDRARLDRHNPQAASAIFAGKTVVEMREKSPAKGRPAFWSEIYLPIVHNGKMVAIIEAHVDLTEQRELFNEILLRAGTVFGLLVAAAFGIPAIAWYRQHKLLRQTTAELREKNLRLDGAVNNISQALLMFDSEARLVLCNDRYRQMYGLSPEMVRPGTSLRSLLIHRKKLGNFSSDPEKYCADTLADIATGKPTAKTLELSDGRVIARIDQPLPNGAWVSTHQDITELHHAQRDAEQAHARLTAVIDAMPAGLIFYNDQDRLVLSNKCYTNMHGATADVRVKGARFEDILRAAVAREAPDDAVGREEEWIAARLAEHAAPQGASEHHYPDGRWLRVQACKTADGGSIGIHIDITELKQREKELNVQNMRFEAALQNMSHGLAMFDRDQRLVICNERFAQVYALPPELVKPGIRLEEILKYRVASGSLRAPDRDDFVATRMAHVVKGEPSDSILELSDGRLIAIGHRPMADGGFVSTHEDVTERRRSEDQIAHLARHDTLTGLPNRVLFREYMESALARVRRGEILALHCVDLDQFKMINDVLGHPAGDALLTQVAARIRSCIRETDLVVRFGGDEFAVVQAGLQRPEEAGLFATRIVRELSEPYDCENHPASISASIGIAMAPVDGTDTDQLLRKADIAMYRAKADERRTFRHFSPDMDAALQVRRLLALDLERAMKMQEFELFYQPVINIRSEEVIGFEALLRWRHPERGLVLPSEFIPIAEEKGLILELGEWVLRRACRDAVGWPGELSVAVNLSPLQLRSRKLVRTVVHALAESGLGVRRLELEITESVLLQENTQTPANLTQLKNLGVAIAMDDFGTGYSSLSSLNRFSFDKIKIDRSFVSGLSEGSHATAIVRALVSLANSLGIVVTAEGVETEEQLQWLRAEGCHEVQGYLFSPPRPSNEIAEVLARCRQLLAKAA
jgi:diguanylate cyclase (GGDEF)-like protein